MHAYNIVQSIVQNIWGYFQRLLWWNL